MAVSQAISRRKRDTKNSVSVGLICPTVEFKSVDSLRKVQPSGTVHGGKAVNHNEKGKPLGTNAVQEKILAENGWLNDEMINRAMKFVNMEHPLQRQLGCDETTSWDVWRAKALESYWFTKVEKGEVSAGWITKWMKAQGMTKGQKPKLDCVMIPGNHKEVHWALAVVFPLLRKIAILDSFVTGAFVDKVAVYDNICTWLQAHMEDDFDKQEWDLLQLPCPQQENLSDCGIHVALNAWFLSKGIWPMAHKDMRPKDRRLFVADMVNKDSKACPVVIRKVL